MKIALKITPQRSTQYADMTALLAPAEVLASPLGVIVHDIQSKTLAGQPYLYATTETAEEAEKVAACLPVLIGRLGAVNESYEYFDHIGDIEGPLLRPINPEIASFVPWEMAEVRRYKGKTNEIFTRVLLNVAIFASAYRSQYTERLRILDPLCGGGTTLFLALAAGYDVFGIEQDRQDVETTVVFVRQYLQSEHIHFNETAERGRRAGHRYQFEIGRKGNTRHLVLAHGETADGLLHMREVPGGPKMHAIVGDLPYGIQHFGEIATLLSNALPVWEQMLLPGGTIALSWNATRIHRDAMISLFEQYTRLRVQNEPPYTQFEHAVDRVIKRRDIIVAVKEDVTFN